MPKPEIERRRGILTDEDIRAIAIGVADLYDCKPCPFDEKAVQEAVGFYQNLNKWFDGTKKTVWNTVLRAIILTILALIGLGFWGKFK